MRLFLKKTKFYNKVMWGRRREYFYLQKKKKQNGERTSEKHKKNKVKKTNVFLRST